MVGGRDVYVNQQIRPHLPQGGHMMNPSGTSNYIPQYNVQKQPIMHGGEWFGCVSVFINIFINIVSKLRGMITPKLEGD